MEILRGISPDFLVNCFGRYGGDVGSSDDSYVRRNSYFLSPVSELLGPLSAVGREHIVGVDAWARSLPGLDNWRCVDFDFWTIVIFDKWIAIIVEFVNFLHQIGRRSLPCLSSGRNFNSSKTYNR